MSIQEMLARIETVDDKESGGGATNREIADAERALGVRFPASYRAFLASFGWMRLLYDELYGVGRDVPSYHALVGNTLSERFEMMPHIPPHLLPILNDGAGNHYCLDTSRPHGDECPVVFWDHEHEDGSDQTPREVSPSFDQWLIGRIVDSPYANEP